MRPISLPEYLIQQVIPDFNGPTACLIAFAKQCRQSDSVFMRQVLSRAACLTAIATAAIESLVHATLMVATVPLIALRRVVWMSLLGFSMCVGGAFYLMHRDALEISPTVWFKRIVIHVFLFLRVPTVVFNHLKVWAGLMRDHLIFARQATAFALSVELGLREFFSLNHVMAHAKQASGLALFSAYSLIFGITNPSDVIKEGYKLDLGPSAPLSLFGRIRANLPPFYSILGKVIDKTLIFIGDHFLQVAAFFGLYSLYYHYNEDYKWKISKDPNLTPFNHALNLPGRMLTGFAKMTGHIVGGVKDWIVPGNELRDRLKDLETQFESLKQQKQEPTSTQAQPPPSRDPH